MLNLYNLNDIACFILFTKGLTEDSLNEKIKGCWQYRKNKTIEDVKIAVKKAFNKKTCKIELEIEWLALHLVDVFKKSKGGI